MRTALISIAVASLLAVAATRGAQTDDPPPPKPIPTTPEPAIVEWRLGFDLGNVTVIETPEINPQHDPNQAVRQALRSLGDSPMSFGLGLLRFDKVVTQADRLVNPRQWTVVHSNGAVQRTSFRALGVFMGSMMRSEEGGYHLVSVDPMPSNPFIGIRREPSPNSLIFAFAGPLKTKPQVRPRVLETKWRDLKPLEDMENLPAGYEAAKTILSTGNAAGRVVYGSSIDALIGNQFTRLWLLNFGNGDPNAADNPWGIFTAEDNELRALYVFKAKNSNYIANLQAAIDLDQDGTDELIVEEDYRNGTAFEVLSMSGGKYEKIYRSYFRGVR